MLQKGAIKKFQSVQGEFKQCVFFSEKEWGFSTCYRFERSELLCPIQALQKESHILS